MHFDIDDDIGALLSRLFEYCSPPPITPEHYRPPIPKRPSQATWHARAKKPRPLSMNWINLNWNAILEHEHMIAALHSDSCMLCCMWNAQRYGDCVRECVNQLRKSLSVVVGNIIGRVWSHPNESFETHPYQTIKRVGATTYRREIKRLKERSTFRQTCSS